MTTRSYWNQGLIATAVLLGVALFLIGGTVTAQAGTALDTRYGSPATLLMPEINGMGGTGTALYRGGISNVFNPAFLVDETGKRFDAAMSLEQAHEDRFVPLFDTFESFVTDIAIASNRNHYFGSGFGFASRIQESNGPLVLAVSLTDKYAFAYNFVEEFRDPVPFDLVGRDQLFENRTVEMNGTLHALSGGGGFGFNENISLGASMHYAFGSREDIISRRYYEVQGTKSDPENSISEQGNVDLTGVNFTVGGRFQLNDRLEFGLAWETPLEVTGDLQTNIYRGADLDSVQTHNEDLVLEYPQRFRGGFSYHPRSDPRTVFTAEAVYTVWSELTDSRVSGTDNPQLLEDTVDMRVGVEHLFYNGFAARFGFRHLDSYREKEASLSAFTAGIGIPVVGGAVSASVELSKISSVQEHWFDYETIIDTNTYLATETADVDDTQFRFGLGYTGSF